MLGSEIDGERSAPGESRLERVLPPLLTEREAAKLVNVGTRTLHRWARSGAAPAPIKLNGTLCRYRRDELMAWIADGCPRLR